MNNSAENLRILEAGCEKSLAKKINARLGGLDVRELLSYDGNQGEFVHKMLTGSQAKTAWALRYNCQRLCEDNPIESIGFLTLTVGSYDAEGKFQQVWDAWEASRRMNNLCRRFLPDIFSQCIVATERHASGAIHFHLLGVLRGLPDIRTGYDFNQVSKGDYRSVSMRLRSIWKVLRENLEQFGFGRSELTPIRKTSVAIAGYISKYIEKNVCNRRPDDKYKKLVRYAGWDKTQLKPNDFSWCGKKAIAWRWKVRDITEMVDLKGNQQIAAALGPRWAFHLTKIMGQTGELDNIFPGLMNQNFHHKRGIVQDLVKLMGKRGHRWEMEGEHQWDDGDCVFFSDTLPFEYWKTYPGGNPLDLGTRAETGIEREMCHARTVEAVSPALSN